jgi:hypothetical protein
MNDLSGLTHPTRRLRMRTDLFSQSPSGHNNHTRGQIIESVEKCDCCGSVVLLCQISFTGAKFLCGKCLAP